MMPNSLAFASSVHCFACDDFVESVFLCMFPPNLQRAKEVNESGGWVQWRLLNSLLNNLHSICNAINNSPDTRSNG